MKHCLLILPLSFYSFGQVIKKELERKGYEVQLENDEYPRSMLGKVLGKLNALSLLRRLTLKAYIERYQHSIRFDLVLIIKGRGVGRAAIEFLRGRSERIVAYNFDSFLFNPSPLDWLASVDRYCTFDIADAKAHDLPLVHLFSAIPVQAGSTRRQYDVSALMKNHSQRLQFTDQVLASLPGTKNYIYIFEPNVISFAFNFLKSPLLYLKYWQHIHFKPLPYGDFLAALKDSELTIDYAHPTQTGITIRCFEALSLGVRIITNNAHVGQTRLFDRAAVTHFKLGQDGSTVIKHIEQMLAVAPAPHLRSPQQFMDDLLGEYSAPTASAS